MLSAPRNDQTIRIATLCAYFPGVNRADIMEFVGVDHADAIREPLEYLLAHGYIRRSSHQMGGFDGVTVEWSPATDKAAGPLRCNRPHHEQADESTPLRLVR